MRDYEQTKSEGRTYKSNIDYQKKINVCGVDADIKRKQVAKTLYENKVKYGSGTYATLGATYRLTFHKCSVGKEEVENLFELKRKILEIISSNPSRDDLQSLYYGLLGQMGSRKLKAYIDNSSLTYKEAKQIGYNDYYYFGIEEKEGLDKITAYDEGYKEAVEKSLIEDLTGNEHDKDEVVQELISSLEEIEKKKKK